VCKRIKYLKKKISINIFYTTLKSTCTLFSSSKAPKFNNHHNSNAIHHKYTECDIYTGEYYRMTKLIIYICDFHTSPTSPFVRIRQSNQVYIYIYTNPFEKNDFGKLYILCAVCTYQLIRAIKIYGKVLSINFAARASNISVVIDYNVTK